MRINKQFVWITTIFLLIVFCIPTSFAQRRGNLPSENILKRILISNGPLAGHNGVNRVW